MPDSVVWPRKAFKEDGSTIEEAQGSDNWRYSALCAGSDDYRSWFPETPSSATAELAKRRCGQCPVRKVCGQSAVDRGDSYGIFAGFDLGLPAERDQLHLWVGAPVPPRPAERPPRKPYVRRQIQDDRPTVTCTQCGQLFREHLHNAKRCPGCAQRLVSTQEVHAHIDSLCAAHVTLTEVALAARISATTLSLIMRKHWVTLEIATRILSVGLDDYGIPIASPAPARNAHRDWVKVIGGGWHWLPVEYRD